MILTDEQKERICSKLNLREVPVSCANCKHEPTPHNENPCLHCFDLRDGKPQTYWNYTPVLSNVTRDEMWQVHMWALHRFSDHGRSVKMNKGE